MPPMCTIIIPKRPKMMPRYCTGELNRSPKKKYATSAPKTVIIPSHIAETYKRLSDEKLKTRKYTTPIYPTKPPIIWWWAWDLANHLKWTLPKVSARLINMMLASAIYFQWGK